MFLVFLVRAKNCFQQGNKEYKQGDFHRALQLYTEGLQLNCKDDRLKARLYNNRAAAHFRLGMEFQRSIIYSLLKSSSSKSHVVPFYANFSDRLSITPNELKDIQ